MKAKTTEKQAVKRRRPLQARAQLKVDLMLEATMQLLDRGDIESLSTNAIAERAGVSIGTLYQYFDGKQAILDALIDAEIGRQSQRIMKIVQDAPEHSTRERIHLIVAAISKTYGGRKHVHRLLLSHALAHGTAKRLSPLFAALTAEGATGQVTATHRPFMRLKPAEAFVLVQTIAGVMRMLILAKVLPAPRQEIEGALVDLVDDYLSRR